MGFNSAFKELNIKIIKFSVFVSWRLQRK